MKRALAIGLGVASFSPLAAFTFLFGKILFDTDFRTMMRIGSEQFTRAYFEKVFLLQLVTIVLVIGYLVNIFLSKKVQRKGLWAFLIFFGNIITIPIYWYLYFWRKMPEHIARP